MPGFTLRPITLACLLGASAACSQTANPPTLSANTATSSDASGNAPAPLDCSKVFAPSDVASIFSVPAKISRDQIRRGCTFDTQNSVDPYGGSLNVNTGGYDDVNFSLPWDDVTRSTDSANFQPLPGVGDRAFFRKTTGTEFFSKKGEIYCIASMTSLDQATVNHIAEQSPEQRAKAMGALCNKAFATH